ncbi:exodeoxyribonuclease VII small subunit [Kineothrix sp. MB12-C1]|uniref:exodeoxyribonuclease VII small subunit n=1 Tax=Kineothrix sp. MB12-C1 TaxID=3070215 RepID=UPI0027D30004|nr:exodeoxyribonuclease VII small subunit [Kineothrix sp. MB12-C1]WMC92936.1 exodeoxyribonuclease VII small subunit [Kineothrix sp. MB12-C1]
MGEAKQELTLEEAFSALEEAVSKLEAEDISLEESFQVYKEGMNMLKYCNDKIDKVEKKVLQINEDGEINEF